MEEITKNIEELLTAIKRSEIYVEYKKQEAVLDQNPELKERVNQFRANNFQMQSEAGRDNLFHVVEKLSHESAELRKVPEVNAYLDAELALCKLMQIVCRDLTDGIDMHVPEL